MKMTREKVAEKLATIMTGGMTPEQLVNIFYSDQMEYFMNECDDHELDRLARKHRIVPVGHSLEVV